MLLSSPDAAELPTARSSRSWCPGRHRAAQRYQLQYPSHNLWARPKHSSPQTQAGESLCLGGLVLEAGHLEGIRNRPSAGPGQPEGSALVEKSQHL